MTQQSSQGQSQQIKTQRDHQGLRNQPLRLSNPQDLQESQGQQALQAQQRQEFQGRDLQRLQAQQREGGSQRH